MRRRTPWARPVWVLLPIGGLLGGTAAAAAAAPGIDLVVTQTAQPQQDGALLLTINVHNGGPVSAGLVRLREFVLAEGYTGLTYTSNRPARCVAIAPPPGFTLGRRCEMQSLRVQRTWTLTFRVTGPSGTPVSATADAPASFTGDPNVSNNKASVSSYIGPVANLAVHAGPPGPVNSFGFTSRTLTVGNAGPNTAVGVTVMATTNDFPAMIEGPGCSGSGPSVCDIGDVAQYNGWVGKVTYNVGAWAAVQVYGRASFDPDGSDNGLPLN